MTRTFSSKELIDYGQSHGYSPKEINQVLNSAKSDLVNYGINAGYKGSDINKVLNTAGYTNYNPLTSRANWENLLPNIAKGAKEFASNMGTMGGAMVQPFIDIYGTPKGQRMEAAKQRFANAINDDKFRRTALGAIAGAGVGSRVGAIGTIGGLLTGGLIGLLGPSGLANAYLQSYDTSTKDIGKVIEGKKSLGDLATDIVQGGLRNPFYSGVDLLTLGGAKALGNTGRAIGNKIPADAPLFIQELFPGTQLREFSRAGTNALQAVKARNVELLEPIEQLKSSLKMDDEQLARFIIENESNLSGKELEIAKKIKSALKTGERRAIEYGLLDAKSSKDNIIAQYGMNKLKAAIPDIIHNDVVKYIQTGNMSPRMAEVVLKNPDVKVYLDDIIKQGGKLYDEDKIAFLTQELVPTTDPRGEVIASGFAKVGPGYFNTNRIIGRATPKDYAVGNKLTDSLEFQQNQIGRVTGAIDTMETLLLQPGMKKIVNATTEVPKGYTVINKSLFRKNLANAFQSGKDVDINRILKQSNLAEAGAYLIPNVYFKALENMFAPARKSTGLMASFKKTVLANPHWFGLNRVGNWTNNSMGGVKFVEDYGDALRHQDIIPKQLANQTSLNAYIGNDNVIKLSDAFTRPAKDIVSGFKKFADSNKGLKDIQEVSGSLAANVNNIFSNPIYKLEAAAERMDRYANFIRQAKRYAKENKIKDWKEVVKKSDKDTDLFNYLNTNVNKDLGDYLGRSYLVPNEVYEKLGNWIPFYRFLTQTARTTAHQMANHPLAFQSTVMAPSRAGKELSDYIVNQYNLDPSTYEGGVPYKQQLDGTWRFLRTEPLPAGAVASDLLSGTSPLSMISPQYTLATNILSYKKGEGWLPTSPGLTAYKMAHGTTKGYEPTIGERYGYAVSQLANTFYAPVRTTRGWGRELTNTLRGVPTLSNYDTNIFATNPLSYGRELPVETIGKWAGIQTRPYWNKIIERPRKPKKNELKKMSIYRQQYEQNTKR